MDWLPRVTQVLRHTLPDIEFKVVSLQSPSLANALQRAEVDLGFLRVESRPDLRFDVVAQEPLIVVMPSGYRLAKADAIDPRRLADEIFIGSSDIPHVLGHVVAEYFSAQNIKVQPSGFLLNDYGTGISLVSSTGGVTLLPAYVQSLMPRSVVSRKLKGVQPTIDIAVGYRHDNRSPILKQVLDSILS